MKTLKKYWLAVITLVILPINISAQSLKEKAESGDKEAQYKYAKSLEDVDKRNAFQWVKKSAEQGYAPAQCSLGNCYYNGQGIDKNYEQAVYWYRKSAEQGNETAQYNLGLCYSNGRGITQNDEQAVYWYRKSARQGFALAQCSLGYYYEKGQGIDKNYEQAVYWYRKSAEQDDADAQYALALLYLHGAGVEKDSIAAADLLLSSACGGMCIPNLLVYDREKFKFKAYEKLEELSELDKSPKQYYFLTLVGCMFDAMHNFPYAEKYYKRAIDKGSGLAMAELGLLYYCLSPCTDPSKRLLDPKRTRPIDEDLFLKYSKTTEWNERDAAYWLEKAVNNDFGDFVYEMAGDVYSYLMDTYVSGVGTSIDLEKAVDIAYIVCSDFMDSTYNGTAIWNAELVLRLALSSDLPQLHNKLFNIYSKIYTYVKDKPSDWEDIEALDDIDDYNIHLGCLIRIAYSGLGKCYYKGFGVKKDYNKAFNYLSEAAENGISGEPMRLLAACYRYGRGVKADPNKDKEWSARAAKCGDEQAQKLEELRSRWGLK